jgi:hypothetical protein
LEHRQKIAAFFKSVTYAPSARVIGFSLTARQQQSDKMGSIVFHDPEMFSNIMIIYNFFSIAKHHFACHPPSGLLPLSRA